MREFIKEELDYVIENEIDYLKREQEVSGFSKDNFKNLLMLETLNNTKKEEIIEEIVNDEGLTQTINETIHYYLYNK